MGNVTFSIFDPFGISLLPKPPNKIVAELYLKNLYCVNTATFSDFLFAPYNFLVEITTRAQACRILEISTILCTFFSSGNLEYTYYYLNVATMYNIPYKCSSVLRISTSYFKPVLLTTFLALIFKSHFLQGKEYFFVWQRIMFWQIQYSLLITDYSI